MATKVPTETIGVNSKADDSSTGTLHPADVAAQKQPTLVQRLNAVVDAKIVGSFNNWAILAGMNRQTVNKFLKRIENEPHRDMSYKTVSRLADAVGVKREWLMAGTTLQPEMAVGDDHLVRRLLMVLDLMLGAPMPGASASENDRAFSEALAESEPMTTGDEDALSIQAARAIHAAGRVDTKKGWAHVIDSLAHYELVDQTAKGDRDLKQKAGRLRPNRSHEEHPDAVYEPDVTPPTPIAPKPKGTEHTAKKERAPR